MVQTTLEASASHPQTSETSVDPQLLEREGSKDPLSDAERAHHSDARLTGLANRTGKKIKKVIALTHPTLSGQFGDRRSMTLADAEGLSCVLTEEMNESGIASGYFVEIDADGQHLLVKYMPGRPPRLQKVLGFGEEDPIATANGQWQFNEYDRGKNERDPRRRTVRTLIIRARQLIHDRLGSFKNVKTA